MDINDERIRNAVEHTEILRPPKQTLSTFGTTKIYYYLITEPIYTELMKDTTETAVREGRVIAERPRIVTPHYLSHLDGFSPEARKYLDELSKIHGTDAPGLFYTYRNEPKELNIVSDDLHAVAEKLNAELDQRGDPLTSIIKGQDELWDVSLMKFIYEMTRSSVRNNLMQMGARGLLDMDPDGVPMDARVGIEELFRQVSAGEIDPVKLKKELDHWGVFQDYEDRFLNIFRRGR